MCVSMIVQGVYTIRKTCHIILYMEHVDVRLTLSKHNINDFQTNVMMEINKNEHFFTLPLSLYPSPPLLLRWIFPKLCCDKK